MSVRAVEWIGGLDGVLRLIYQTRLPAELVFAECRKPETVFEAIRMLRVRGAPAIGVAAAMGAVLGIRNTSADASETLIERSSSIEARTAAEKTPRYPPPSSERIWNPDAGWTLGAVSCLFCSSSNTSSQSLSENLSVNTSHAWA